MAFLPESLGPATPTTYVRNFSSEHVLPTPQGSTFDEAEDTRLSRDESTTEKCCRELGIDSFTGELLKSPVDSVSLLSVQPETPEDSPCSKDCAPTSPLAVNHLLRDASLKGNFELVRKMISMGATVNAPIQSADEEGDVFVTLLHLVAGRPELPQGQEVLQEILKGRANLNARSSLGCTPLARACLQKNRPAAEMLLEYGADTVPVDDRGRNAMRCAVSLQPCSGEEVSGGLVSLLAARRANLENGGDAPPLHEAVRQGNRPAVLALLHHGAKPSSLHAAVEQAPVCIIEDLLKAQANPFQEDVDGKSVLDVAFRRGDEEVTTLLRDFIGDLERRHARGPVVMSSVSESHPKTTISGTPSGTELGEGDEPTLGLSTDISQKRQTSRKVRVRSDVSENSRSAEVRNLFMAGNRWSKAVVLGEESRKRSWHCEKFARFQMACRRLIRHRSFQGIMFAALLMVLFFPDLWVVCDVDGNGSLDAILIVLLLLFFTELMLQTIAMPRSYVNSFFFWMDVVGLLSVPLDLSVVTENLPQSLDNAVLVRAARTARLGARAGRFTKLVKLLRFLPGVQMESHEVGGTAKTMSNTLNSSLSTRISCLIIVMVMVLPLFNIASYPENDFSMKAWMNSLEFTLQRYGAEAMRGRLAGLESFYSDKDYFPIEVQWRAQGMRKSQRLKGRRPRRQLNELQVKADGGELVALFNFGPQNQADAACNVVLIIVIILLMMGFSMLMSNSVSAIVLRPLENLLDSVRATSNKIFESVTHVAEVCTTQKGVDEDSNSAVGSDSGFGKETELLEKVIGKLACLSAITMKTSAIDTELLNETDRAVLQGLNIEQLPNVPTSESSDLDSISCCQSYSHRISEDDADMLVSTLGKFVRQARLSWNYIDSWDFNVLALEEMQRQLCCLSFMIFQLGLRYTSDLQARLASFVEVAAAGYSNPAKAPYHNWSHGVDVTHTLFRLLNLCATERFLSNLERFSLIVSGICHDIGHPGLNNPFLVETSHELAIRYNDHSPLENMHCARLFEIASQPKTAVFECFDQREYREARQVCIEAILHTDNVHHFPMVKEMQMLYEVHSDIFDAAACIQDYPPREICEVLSEAEKRKSLRNLLLHFSDVSNPMKPFEICKKWAWNIIEEFFNQGDLERSLGVTVQPLNDRGSVNKPYSQVGFIEFFVAPFALATAKVLPPVIPCVEQLRQNLDSWVEEWMLNTQPPPDPEEEIKLLERVARLSAKLFFKERAVKSHSMAAERFSERTDRTVSECRRRG